jgi:uracil-DNA glycosylase
VSDQHSARLAAEFCGGHHLFGDADGEAFRTLLDECRAEALRTPFPLDSEVYTQHSGDCQMPILAAGNLGAPVCVFGRDLGREEIRHFQPQVGAAGKLVRRGLLTSAGLPLADDDPQIERALRFALLTNTVPFKPPGNKAYSTEVKERFRPYVARLLGSCWKGDRVITLGTEAFFWFSPYLAPGEAKRFWESETRYEQEVTCVLNWEERGSARRRELAVAPLPHPSPLNRKWLAAFPSLLTKRLKRNE